MGWIDRIPRAGNLYIGGLAALVSQPGQFAALGITHVLSVIDYEIYSGPAGPALEKYKRLQVQLEDETTALLLPHFDATGDFIAEALAQPDDAVFVHCAMGRSRSAAVVAAYLMRTYELSPSEALAQICEARPVCSPNPGFREQLDVYYGMLRAATLEEAKRIYESWLEERWTGEAWNWRKRTRRSGKM